MTLSSLYKTIQETEAKLDEWLEENKQPRKENKLKLDKYKTTIEYHVFPDGLYGQQLKVIVTQDGFEAPGEKWSYEIHNQDESKLLAWRSFLSSKKEAEELLLSHIKHKIQKPTKC